MRISDWSSDVCSYDLATADALCARADGGRSESDAGRAGASREYADADFPVSVGAVIPTRGRCKPTPISVRVEQRRDTLKALAPLGFVDFARHERVLSCRLTQLPLRPPPWRSATHSGSSLFAPVFILHSVVACFWVGGS